MCGLLLSHCLQRLATPTNGRRTIALSPKKFLDQLKQHRIRNPSWGDVSQKYFTTYSSTSCKGDSDAGTTSASYSSSSPYSPLLDRHVSIKVRGDTHKVDSLLLRDACSCKLCVDPSTTQKSFKTTDIPENIRAELLSVDSNGSFSVSWTVDIPGFEKHISIYSPTFFSSAKDRYSTIEQLRRKFPRVCWDQGIFTGRQITYHYRDFLDKTSVLRSVIRDLMQFGLAFISSVPPTPGSVEKLAVRIGPLMDTIYGRTWNVRSVESPKNVADRDSDLDFHMVRNVPGLHVITTS